MRIKFNKEMLTQKNLSFVSHIIKMFAKDLEDCGYTPSSLNVYISYQDEDGDAISDTVNYYPCYTVGTKERPRSQDKLYNSVTCRFPDSEEVTAYIYGGNDSKIKWTIGPK